MSQGDKEEQKAYQETAHKAFEAHRKLISDSFNLMGSFATAAMRAPALAAAAGIAGLLGVFTGNKPALINTLAVSDFNLALIAFCSCIGLSAVATGFAYLAQKFYTSALSDHSFHYDFPFVRETTASKRRHWAGFFFELLAIASILAALGMLAAAAFHFVKVVQFLTAAQ